MEKYKVIFHIDEISKWKLLLANVSNLLIAMGNEDYLVEVLLILRRLSIMIPLRI